MKKLTQTLKKNNISNYELITGPNQKLSGSNITNIFIATNYDSLVSWKYSLNKVFYVFDYGLDITFHFDYNYFCYVETHSCANKK